MAVKREIVLAGLADGPVRIHYPGEELEKYRVGTRGPQYFAYWKDITFGIYIPQKYDEDTLMLLIEAFDCGIELDSDPFGGYHLPVKFLENNKDTMAWDVISHYWELDWSFELLQRFEGYWVTNRLIENHSAFNYCLKDDPDDEFIEKVLKE